MMGKLGCQEGNLDTCNISIHVSPHRGASPSQILRSSPGATGLFHLVLTTNEVSWKVDEIG